MSTATVSSPEPWKRWIPAPPVIAAWVILLGMFLWTYWWELCHVVHVWATTPDMGHGFAVPVFCAYLLWRRQEMVDPWPTSGSWWCIPFFAGFALFCCLVKLMRYERELDSLFPFFIGMALAIGGWKALRWAWPSILMLIFMDPLPHFVQEGLAKDLQYVATHMTVYVLQTVGVAAIASGNVIQLSDPQNKLNVAEACSGLRMMTVTYAVCVGACFVLREPLWKKIVLVVSAAPIAVISNVARISMTGMLKEWISPQVGDIFHDWFGYLEVVPAMLLVWGLLSLLSALFIEPPDEGPLVFAEGVGMRRRSSPPGMEGIAQPGGAGPLGGAPRRPPES
jgi:exosortase